MRNSSELPALNSSAPVTTRTSRWVTGTALTFAVQSAQSNRIGQSDVVARCDFTAPPPNECCRYHSPSLPRAASAEAALRNKLQTVTPSVAELRGLWQQPRRLS